jgi:hypothetical protein
VLVIVFACPSLIFFLLTCCAMFFLLFCKVCVFVLFYGCGFCMAWFLIAQCERLWLWPFYQAVKDMHIKKLCPLHYVYWKHFFFNNIACSFSFLSIFTEVIYVYLLCVLLYNFFGFVEFAHLCHCFVSEWLTFP